MPRPRALPRRHWESLKLLRKGKYSIICKLKYAEQIGNMHEISCTKYARNIHKYENEKYAKYVHNKPKICINMLIICIYMRYMLEYV